MACAHHFDLPSPDGASCIGVCRKCGEEREHSNGADIDTTSELRRQAVRVAHGHMDEGDRLMNQLLLGPTMARVGE